MARSYGPTGAMCGGFGCSKNALIALNTVYVLVAIVLISVGAYSQHASIVTSVPVVGGVIAMGVFLGVLAIAGCYAAAKHHQVLLFFYMITLFAIFVVQFSLALACLAVSEAQVEKLVETSWVRLQSNGLNSTIYDAQQNFDCCGLRQADQVTTGWHCENLPCGGVASCPPCVDILKERGAAGAQSAGGVGLFFSFTEIVGIWLAMRYRNQKDPNADPGRLFR